MGEEVGWWRVPDISLSLASSFGVWELANFGGGGVIGNLSGSLGKMNLTGVPKSATGEKGLIGDSIEMFRVRFFRASAIWGGPIGFNCARKLNLPLLLDFRIFSKLSKFNRSFWVWFENSKYCRLFGKDSPLV